jgi:hypothetical protein
VRGVMPGRYHRKGPDPFAGAQKRGDPLDDVLPEKGREVA